jgi:hypothetical protein
MRCSVPSLCDAASATVLQIWMTFINYNNHRISWGVVMMSTISTSVLHDNFTLDSMTEEDSEDILIVRTLKPHPGTLDYRIAVMKDILYVVDIYLPPIIISIGLIGNLLSWVLMSQHHYSQSTNCLYMRFLAVSDSLYLLTQTLQRWLMVIIADLLLKPPTVHQTFCRQYYFFHGFSVTVSSYLLVVMSFNRLLALMFPLKVKTWCTMSRARISILAAVCMALTIHLSSFWRIKHRKYATWLCPFHFEYDVLYQTVYAAMCVYIPATFLFLINIAIIITVKRSNDKRKILGCKGDKEKDQTITKTLIIVSFAYLCCLIPQRIHIIFFTDWEPTHDIAFWKMFDRLTLDIVLTMEYLNFALNAFLYIFVCSRFRKELRGILCRQSGRPQDPERASTTTGLH